MSYVEDNLMKDERVIYRAKLHWISFLYDILFAIVGLIVLRWSETAGFIILIIALLDSILLIIRIRAAEFAVTNKRVIIKVGVVSRHTLELLLTKIESTSVDQGILGSILNYGDITIIGTGGTKETFTSISNPLEFHRQTQNATPQS